MTVWAEGSHDPVHAYIADWEYGCCGTTPAVGAQTTGQLVAFPADDDHHFTAPAPLAWDSELELIRFPGGAAWWDPTLGDPNAGAVRLVLTWHESSTIAPEVVATITSVHECSGRFLRDEQGWHFDPGSREYEAVEAAERFPDSSAEASDDEVIRSVTGAVVGLAITTITEPAPEEVADLRVRREIAARTAILTGPSILFGETVPGPGRHLTLDLAAPELTIRGGENLQRRVVAGEVVRVHVVREAMPGLAGFGDVEPGLPAEAVTDPMFVQFVVDAAEMPPSAD